jgi:hypothetical protein
MPVTGNTGGNGANFSVAYMNASGTDVVHVVLDQPQPQPMLHASSWDLRSTITGGKLGAPVKTALYDDTTVGRGLTLTGSGSACDIIDCPTVAIGGDGKVYEGTGWQIYSSPDPRAGTNCDLDVFQSSVVESGGAWSASFAQSGYFVSAGYTNGHFLMPLPSLNRVAGAFPEPGSGNDYATVAWADDVTTYTGAPGSSMMFTGPYVFSDQSRPEGSDDWAACRVSDSEIHALRHVVKSGVPTSFDAAITSGKGANWTAETAPPDLASAMVPGSSFEGTGLVILSDPDPSHGMIAFAIGADGSVSYVPWKQGAWGTSWTQVVLPLAGRAGLAGSGCGSTRPLLFWTEPGQNQIVGMDVTSLF